MRISQAGLQSDLPTPRFSGPSTNRRESHLGLRRQLGLQITTHPQANARVPLVDALHAAARGVNGTASERVGDVPRTRRTVVLRRSDSITWAQPSDGPVHNPRPRSAAPWRG
jgi:hypothetical protein